jgi:hypothetical protein
MTIYRLTDRSAAEFAGAPEIFAGVQLGTDGAKYYPVLGSQVAVELDNRTFANLEEFYNATWGEVSSSGIIPRYQRWIGSLKEIELKPYFTSRSGLTSFIASALPPPPPPPPGRPDLTPRYPPPPSLPKNLYGHLPFKTTTRPDEHFYRFEPWPTSRKITTGASGSIAEETYASPSAELPFLNTGFAAVARNALPTFFPAVFRY